MVRIRNNQILHAMKKITLWCLWGVLFLPLPVISLAQNHSPDFWGDYVYGFEDTTYRDRLSIDTVHYPHNIWQIGAPQKNRINEAYSIPNVIITDTRNAYPPNNTSVFEIVHQAQEGFGGGEVAVFSGFYHVDTDSLSDYGIMEFSPDNGTTWINLLTDTLYHNYYHWFTGKPVLTGSSDGWKFFGIQLAGMHQVFAIDSGDLVRFRVSFISDELQENRDGLAFDDLHFQDHCLGINNEKESFSIRIFPNPCQDVLHISLEDPYKFPLTLNLLDIHGKIVKKKTLLHDTAPINLQDISPGVYLVVLTNNSQIIYQQKIVKP